MNNLKPCPFCGNPDITFTTLVLCVGLYKTEIICSHCWVTMDVDYADINKEEKIEELINRWNTRYDEKDTYELCQKLGVKPFEEFRIKAKEYKDDYDEYMLASTESNTYRIGTKGIEYFSTYWNSWQESYFDINKYKVIKEQ